jgi:hypothetical protein
MLELLHQMTEAQLVVLGPSQLQASLEGARKFVLEQIRI